MPLSEMHERLPCLLDTHAWVWLVEGHSRLAKSPALPLIELAAKLDHLYISAISVWEFAMLHRKGRLSVSCDIDVWIKRALLDSSIQVMDLSIDILVQSAQMSDAFHGDPADRMIATTARLTRATLVSADAQILRYADAGDIRVQAV